MKTYIFLFCSIAFGFNYNSSFSQNVKITINSDQEISVIDVFEIIKKQTNYTFIYRTDVFENAPKLKLKAGTIKAHELLVKALNYNKYTYEITPDRTILIREKLKSDNKIFQQTITGMITDKGGNPLAGVNIIEKDTQNGVMTNFDGSYSINVSSGNTILVFSYVGYKSQEISVNNNTIIDVKMVIVANELDEVVLTGYTNTKKEVSTASAEKITKRQIARQVTTNLDNRLEGLVTGLTLNTVTPDGGEAGLELIIRGVSTFDQGGTTTDPILQARNALNRQPLIVVDGFPYEGPFNDIDPETIETIDILKDVAATAIWGNRASNGVIVITTKRGRVGEAVITFNSYYTSGTKQNLDDLQLASSATTIDILSQFQEIETSTFTNRVRSIANPGAFNPNTRYRNVNPFEEIWVLFHRGSITEVERDARLAALGEIDSYRDFEEHLIRGGIIKQNSFSIRGGAEKVRYSFTASHVDEERPDVGDDFSRLNLALTTDLIFNDKFSAVVDVSLSSSNKENNGIGVSSLFTGGQTSVNRFSRLVDDQGNFTPIINVNSEDREQFLNFGFDDPSYNPILDQTLRDNSFKTFNLRLAGGLTYKFTDWLVADFKYQHNRINNLTRNHKSVDLFETRRNNNNYISDVDTGNGVSRLVPYGGTLERNESFNINNIYRGSLSFDKSFKDVHYVTALMGMEVSESKFINNKQFFVGYDDNTGIYNVNFNHAQFLSSFGRVGGFLNQGSFLNRNFFIPEVVTRNIASFANLTYSYDQKYNFDISGKINQATAFGIKKRLSKPLLWGAGFSWNIHKENFFKSTWTDNLKLRFSYGSNGNIRSGLTSFTTIGLAGGEPINGGNYAFISSPGNQNLSFETTTTKNLGVDFRIFDRISGSFDIYDKQSKDLLARDNSSPTFGQGDIVLSNSGRISNKGFELSLNADIINTDNFSWNTNFNISNNKNRVEHYGLELDLNATNYFSQYSSQQIRRTGHPVSSQVRFRWAGLDNEGNPQIYDESNNIIGYLDYINNTPSSDALVNTKPFIAPTFGGLTNTINYKNLSLSFLISYKFGHVFQESLEKKYPYQTPTGFSTAFHEDVANAWEQPGDENTTDIPAIPRTIGQFDFATFSFIPGENDVNRRFIFQNSDLDIHDASHIRLRDITLRYTMENSAVESLGINSINLMFQTRNLGLLWAANDEGIDPESVPLSGRAVTFNTNFPRAFRPGIKVPVSFVFGVNINF